MYSQHRPIPRVVINTPRRNLVIVSRRAEIFLSIAARGHQTLLRPAADCAPTTGASYILNRRRWYIPQCGKDAPQALPDPQLMQRRHHGAVIHPCQEAQQLHRKDQGLRKAAHRQNSMLDEARYRTARPPSPVIQALDWAWMS